MSDISGIVEHFPYLGIFALLVLGDIGLPFPKDTTLILSAYCNCGLSNRVKRLSFSPLEI